MPAAGQMQGVNAALQHLCMSWGELWLKWSHLNTAHTQNMRCNYGNSKIRVNLVERKPQTKPWGDPGVKAQLGLPLRWARLWCHGTTSPCRISSDHHPPSPAACLIPQQGLESPKTLSVCHQMRTPHLPICNPMALLLWVRDVLLELAVAISEGKNKIK